MGDGRILNLFPFFALRHNRGYAMADLKAIYAGMNDNERFGLSFGLFPVRLEKENLTNTEAAELIRMSQSKSGVVP